MIEISHAQWEQLGDVSDWRRPGSGRGIVLNRWLCIVLAASGIVNAVALVLRFTS